MTGGSLRLLLALLCLSVLHVKGEEYYCLEDYIKIGQLLDDVPVNTSQRRTNGQIARCCSASCSATQACTAFRATGPHAAGGSSCLLLTNSTASLPADLQVPPGSRWPHVLSNLTANDTIQLRSVGWTCIKSGEDWDKFGLATHELVHTGVADLTPNHQENGHAQWCVFGTDIAGTNLQQYTSDIHYPIDCDKHCANTSGCLLWTYVAAWNDSGQAPYNCFVKADPFKGENGWTGKPKSDIWIPDSQVHCLNNHNDWRQLGQILSPAVQTTQLNGNYYTVYPERVTWSEANTTCSQLPGGRLAILDDRTALDQVYRDLLQTLPIQTAVKSAWVGAVGVNTDYNPNAPNYTGLAGQPGGVSQSQLEQLPVPAVQRADPNTPGSETTLTWLNGGKVDSSQLRRLVNFQSVWTVHDVIWSQQYVPASAKDVCGRLLIQTPGAGPVVSAASVLPGIWYFDCSKPASFICESTTPPPDEPMHGRTVVLLTSGSEKPSSVPIGTGGNSWQTALAVVLPTFAVLLLVFQVARVYSRKVQRLPEMLRQQGKRALGQPRNGKMSIVVTDIQGFTNLMREDPDQMAQALVVHNQVIKHAIYDNVGFVLEQEGDSFSVAFHDAEDAVAFTLQAQQALLEQRWPPAVQYNDAWEGTASFTNCLTASQQAQLAGVPVPGDAASAASAPQQRISTSFTLNRSRSSTEDGNGRMLGVDENSLAAAADGNGNDAAVMLGRDQSNKQWDLHTIKPHPGDDYAASHSSRSKWCWPFCMRHHDHDLERSTHSSSEAVKRMISGLHNCRQPSVSDRSEGVAGSAITVHPAPWSASSGVHTGAPGRTSHSIMSPRRNQWLQQLLSSPRVQQPSLFKGLRVRMGVATGVVSKGEEVKNSKLYKTAQDVSTAANGGQVLMYEATFSAVRETMWRLGAVRSKGIDFDLLYGRGSKGNKRSRRSSSSSAGSRRQQLEEMLPSFVKKVSRRYGTRDADSQLPDAQQPHQAVALDMGCYEVKAVKSTSFHLQQQLVHQQQQLGAVIPGVTEPYILWGRELGDKLVQQYQQFLQQQLQGDQDSVDDLQHDLEQPDLQLALGALTRQSLQQREQHQRHHHHHFSNRFRRFSASQGAGQQQQQHVKHVSGWHSFLEQVFNTPPTATPTRMDLPPSGSSDVVSWDGSFAPLPGAHTVPTMEPTVRIYQVAAPSLVGRAALFGSQLALPDTWHMLDAPYFAAPGLGMVTAVAASPLGGNTSELGSQQLVAADALADSQRASKAPRISQSGQVKQLLSTPQSSSAAPLGAATDIPEMSAPAKEKQQQLEGNTRRRSSSPPAGPAPGIGANSAQSTVANVAQLLTSSSPFAASAVAEAAMQDAGGDTSAAPISSLDSELPSGGAAAAAAAAAAYKQQRPASSAAYRKRPSQELAVITPPESSAPSENHSTLSAAVTANGSTYTVPASTALAPNSSSPVLYAGTSVTSASPAVYRGMSLRSNWALSSVIGVAPGMDQGYLLGQGVSLRPEYPPVAIVFASVENGQQLLQYPSLARVVHRLVHRLMLKLLQSFPGSYLVRAQQGDLKYMVAFTDPVAAAEWCVTLQEAALYLPYPQELLVLSSFGVQLDASGRLVFRGARFKMGICWGTPKCILPDFMGRADYHGPFVNQSARYADAAAHGGQVVADADLASTILQGWRSRGSSNAAGSNINSRSNSMFFPDNSALLKGNSGALVSANSNRDASNSDQNMLRSLQLTSRRACLPGDAVAIADATGDAAAPKSTAAVAVECSWLGSFLFKGNPRPIEMVSFGPVCLQGRSTPAAAPSGKGVRVLQRVGVMDRAVIHLPAQVQIFAAAPAVS